MNVCVYVCTRAFLVDVCTCVWKKDEKGERGRERERGREGGREGERERGKDRVWEQSGERKDGSA